jgi:hypothetical protein
MSRPVYIEIGTKPYTYVVREWPLEHPLRNNKPPSLEINPPIPAGVRYSSCEAIVR